MNGRRDSDRRLERNERIAEIVSGTEYDRRSHADADCEAAPVLFGEPSVCRVCGRPMSTFEQQIYRAL